MLPVRWSQTFLPTMKEIPSDAEIPSHQLMLRAGLIRQLMAGAYTYLPLGWRVVDILPPLKFRMDLGVGAAALYIY